MMMESNKKPLQDSITLGTPGNKGSIKIYFDVDNWKQAKGKISRALLLHEMFCQGEVRLQDLKKHGDVNEDD